MEKIISSKEFYKKLSEENIKELEDLSNKMLVQFNKKDVVYTTGEIPDLFPAYVNSDESNIRVNFPTYIIRVISDNDKMDDIIEDEVKEMLKDIKEIYIHVGNYIAYNLYENKAFEHKYIDITIRCCGLENKKSVKLKVEDILQSKRYQVGTRVGLIYYIMPIQFIDDRKTVFKIVDHN